MTEFIVCAANANQRAIEIHSIYIYIKTNNNVIHDNDLNCAPLD